MGSLSKPSAPRSPDYAAAAQATAQGNLDATRAATDANRVNQYTPYGNLIYNRDPNAATPDQGWSVTQTLSPAQQQMLDRNNTLSIGLLGTAETGLGKVNDLLSNPTIDESKLATMPIQGQSVQDAIMSRLEPQLNRQRNQLENQLANQGIMRGSEAWNNAQTDQGQRENDLLTQAALQGINTGLTSRQQGIQEQAFLQDRPLNVVNALRTGNQVQSPQFTNVPQQQTTTGANMLGATQAQGQFDQGRYNADMGAYNANMGGLFGLGSAGIGAYGLMNAAPLLAAGSDINIKENIVRIGHHPLGIGVYSFTYKPEYQDRWGHGKQVGVMAQEVMEVMPEAVSTHPDGYLIVRYDMIGPMSKTNVFH